MAWSNTSARTKFSVEKSHSLSFSVRVEDRLHVNILDETADECWLTVRPVPFVLGQDDDDLDADNAAPSASGVGFKSDGVFFEITPTVEQEALMSPEELAAMVQESRLFQFSVQAAALDLDPELEWFYGISYVKDGYSICVAAGEFEVAANVTNRGAGELFASVGDVFQLVSTIDGRNLLNVTATLPMPQQGAPGTGTYYTTSALTEVVAGAVTIPLSTVIVAAGRTLQAGDILFSTETKGVLAVVTSISWTDIPITLVATTLQTYGRDGLNALLDQTFRDTSVGQPFAGFETTPPHPTNTYAILKTSVPIPAGVGLEYHVGDYVMHHVGIAETAVSTVLVISVVNEVTLTQLWVRPVAVFPLFLNSLQLSNMLESYVPNVRTVNSKALDANIVLNEDDIAAGVTNTKFSTAQNTKLNNLPDNAALTLLLSGKASSTHGHAMSGITGLETALNGKVDSSDIDTIVVITQAAYTALATKDSRTQYLIQG